MLLKLFRFQNFREDSCDYSGDILEHLELIKDTKTCQLACEHHDDCAVFVYDLESQFSLNCMLLNSGKRSCDVVRGTPQPDFEKCKEDGNIFWP